MCRLGLLLLRMDYHSRLFLYMAVNQEADAEKDERNAEPLSHIQNHILLESDLRLLDEFYQEAHSEASDEECTDEEAAVQFRKSVFIHQYLEDTQKEIAQGLIKLGRMLWFGLSPELEYEAPRKAGHITVYFRIEEVA